jgi:hypothetical protein
VLYTFDEAQCLARSPISRNIRVITSENCSSFGIIDLYTCLRSVVNSSPEIISNLKFLDYAVYTTDYTEPGLPLVGHGMFSWLNLEMESDQLPETSQKIIVGRVCKNMIALYSGGTSETLEITLRLKPISSFSQAQYLSSIKLYKSLASFLPIDFNHSEWAAFLSKNPKLSSFVQTSESFKRLRVPDLNDDNSVQKRQKSTSFLPVEMMDSRSRHNTYTSVSPPQSSISFMSQADMESTITPPSSFDVVRTAGKSYSYNAARKPDWNDIPASHGIISSPAESGLDSRKLADISGKTTSVVDVRRSVSIDEGTKVVAKGSKYKPRITDKAGFSPFKDGSLSCDNCGRVDNTWRRIKVSASGSAPEKDYTFCNPCGLWYSSKKSFRPSHLWNKDGTVTSPPKDKEAPAPLTAPKTRVIRGSKRRSNDPYVGPSIAALLAQNARTKPSYSSSSPASTFAEPDTPISNSNEGAKLATEQTTPNIATPSSTICTPSDVVVGKSIDGEKKTTPKSITPQNKILNSKEDKKAADETIKKPRKRAISKATAPNTPIVKTPKSPKTPKDYKLTNITSITENKENVPPEEVKMVDNNPANDNKQKKTMVSFDFFGDLSGSPSRWMNKFLEDHKESAGDEELMKLLSGDNLHGHNEILGEDFSHLINIVKCPEISFPIHDFSKPKVTLSSSPPGQIYMSEDDSDPVNQLGTWTDDANATTARK